MKKLLITLTFAIISELSFAGLEFSENYDNYAKITTIRSNPFEIEVPTGLFEISNARGEFYASVTDDGLENTGLLVTYSSGSGWQFFDTAFDSQGESIPISSVKREIISRSMIQETFFIKIPPSYITGKYKDGLNIKVYGRGKEFIIKVGSRAILDFVNFYLPRKEIIPLKPQLAEAAKIKSTVSLGVDFMPMTTLASQSIGMPSKRGVLITTVKNGSPADIGGLKTGDILLTINNQEILPDFISLRQNISKINKGETVEVGFLRNGSIMKSTIKF